MARQIHRHGETRSLYDKEAKSGSINITVNVNSIEFGMAKMDEHAKSPEIFDAAKYPTAIYSGKFSKFNGATPTRSAGDLDDARGDQAGNARHQLVHAQKPQPTTDTLAAEDA